MMNRLTTASLIIGLILVFAGVFMGCTPAGTDPTGVATAAPTKPPPPTNTTAPTQAPTQTSPPADTPTPEPVLTGDAVQGGLLYDKWWAALGMESPSGDHPLWKLQTTNTRTGPDTWRCKECHGWDYKGVDGAYGSGSHLTGFPGILTASTEKSAFELLSILKGSMSPDHDFSSLMEEQSLIDLALFMSETVVDYSALVNADKTTWGVAAQGEENYELVCTRCHGPQGSAINFADLEEPEFVGHLGQDNPWEWLHKVRYGQPGWPMPSSINNEWTDEDLANALAYAQTLQLEPLVSGGGLLYDNWMSVLGADIPKENNPLWATQSTNTRTGADTWRCKECHGWDYLGADGAYGSGSHLTGFKGILDAASMSSEELTLWLTGGKNPDHDFSQVMGEIAINALVVFIQQEMMDSAPVIAADTGDPENGKGLFEATCAECHGEDGKKLNFGEADDPEYVGTIAVDNPWEFFHKTAFGQPSQPMPSGLALGWTMDELADVWAYARTLPTR